jgi:hypothetical protein
MPTGIAAGTLAGALCEPGGDKRTWEIDADALGDSCNE